VKIAPLKPLERQLAQAVVSGRELVCSDLDPATLAVTDDERYQIRAEVLRDILIGRHVDHPHPQALRLSHARIVGSLNLDQLAPIIGFELSLCVADEPLTMRGARVPWLRLHGTHAPGILADGSYIEGAVELIRLRISADRGSGAVQLTGAYIRGLLDCSGTTLANGSGPALMADDVKVDGSVSLTGIQAASNCNSATAQLSQALIGGTLSLDNAILANKTGPALTANNLRVGSSAIFSGTRCCGSQPTQATVQLNSAHIGRNLELGGSVLSNDSGSALTAHGIQVDGSAYLRDNFLATGRTQSTVDLNAARISGGLDFTNSRIINPDGLALDLASASVAWLRLTGDAICRSGPGAEPQPWKDNGQLRLDGFIYSSLDPNYADLDQ
jgi:hypothetical protein